MGMYNTMDRSWIDSGERLSREYLDGIEQFLAFAYKDKVESSVIWCPCRTCCNRYHNS